MSRTLSQTLWEQYPPLFGALSAFVSGASILFPSLWARLRFKGGPLSPPTNRRKLVLRFQVHLDKAKKHQQIRHCTRTLECWFTKRNKNVLKRGITGRGEKLEYTNKNLLNNWLSWNIINTGWGWISQLEMCSFSHTTRSCQISPRYQPVNKGRP